jgi:hypothetical protein
MNTKPILACAGNKSEQIDSELLNELLLNFKPGLIGVRQKATLMADRLYAIAHSDFTGDRLAEFKSIINREFLAIQLMEAANLARQESAVTVDAPSDVQAL